MFNGASIQQGFAEPLDLQSVREAGYMFYSCTSRNFPLKKEVVLPNAVNTHYMFDRAAISQAIELDSVSAPVCANAKDMFSNSTFLTAVKSVEIGENSADQHADGVSSMFRCCSNLHHVGNVSAPKATNAESMFLQCGALARIGFIKMPHVVNMSRMFEDDGSLLNICNFVVPSTANGYNMFNGTQLGTRVYGNDGKALFARMRLLGR